MNKLVSLISTGMALSACCAGAFSPAVLAATSPAPGSNGTGQALEIAPPLITLTVNPGQSVTVKLQLRDVSKGNLLVTNQINDFVAQGEDGTPKILIGDQDADNPYSLHGWITPLPSFTLSPQQIHTLSVTINVPANASPGGHYGVIRFSGTPPELEGTGVSLAASLGSLILLTVNGPTTEKLSVQEFSVSHNGKAGPVLEAAPLQFVERIKNEGNLHEEPAGQVSITDMFGNKLATVNVNLPPRNILPASIRKFTQPLDSTVIGNKELFGRYTANLKLTYGKDKQTVTSSIVFWVIPYRLIGGLVVALIGGFFALRFLIRRYNERIIAKAQRTSRRGGKRK